MFRQTSTLISLIAASGILFGAAPAVLATSILFFEAPSERGSEEWDDPDNIDTLNQWLAAIGEVPDFGEDWDGNDWEGNSWMDGQVFDVGEEPGAIFADGVTFSNVGARSSRPALASEDPGSTDAIDRLAWQGDESGESTMFFSNPVDYLGFFLFDTDNEVTYNITFTDGTVETIDGKETDEDRYRFVGFLTTRPTAQISQFGIVADRGSRYGIDELQWGRTKREAPEPGTLWLVAFGALLLRNRRRVDF